MHSTYLDAIRRFEGFTAKADWDYAQFTNGYGTRARHAGEVIDKAEADRRFQAEIAEARAIVERHATGASEGTKAALTSLTFNAGDKWTRSGLGEAVRSGDLERVRDIFVQYNKAGGDVLPGLAQRRLAEAAWIGAPQAPVPTSVSGAHAFATSVVHGEVAADAEAPVEILRQPLVPVGPPGGSHLSFEKAPPTLALAPEFRTASEVADTGGPADADVGRVASAVAGFAGEARLTQLLLASKLIGSASSQSDDDRTSDRLA